MNNLNIIHVAGTKGKGSTCAFTESILRHHGYKTGLFTSPHLVTVRERIRINGEPINEDLFVHYFWNTMNGIKSRESESIIKDIPVLPSYPMFLVCMGINVFIHEAIEATVLEVGVGGEFDCTNFIQRPIVTGVTSLGLDHTIILGDTIDEIAWQKSGIFKENVPAFAVEQDNEVAFNVLLERAVEKKCCSLTKVTALPLNQESISSVGLFPSFSSLQTDLDACHDASFLDGHRCITNFFNSQQPSSLDVEGINYSKISFDDDHRHADEEDCQKQDKNQRETKSRRTMTSASTKNSGIQLILGIPGDVQSLNASLAIRLSHTWLQRMGKTNLASNHSIDSYNNNHAKDDNIQDLTAKIPGETKRDFNGNPSENSNDLLSSLPRETILGLVNCKWPGRYQVFPGVQGDPDLTYFLDGAHTKESIQLCSKWFTKTSLNMQSQLERKSFDSKVKVYRMMIFNVTGKRNALDLMLPLVSCQLMSPEGQLQRIHFDYVVFTPNRLHQEISTTSDQSNFCVDADAEVKKASSLAALWSKLIMESNPHLSSQPVVEAVSCLTDAVAWIRDTKQQIVMQKTDDETRVCIHTLVTGSLLLVGGVLGIVDPGLTTFKSSKSPGCFT